MTAHRVAVSPETVRMIELGHPWVIADSHTKKWPKQKGGDLLELIDQSGRFVATALADPAERVVARVIARNKMTLDQVWLKKRLLAASKLRETFIDRSATDTYRLVNGEGDLLPGLTVDRYGDFLLLQLYGNCWRPHLTLLVRTLDELFKPAGIYEKGRPQNTRELEAVSHSKSFGRLLAGKAAPEKLSVQENGLRFMVSLEKGLDSGLFMDQRKNRQLLMPLMAGKRFLNLFSYTGAFSVAAAAAGASQVTSVDVSPHYTDRAKGNFELNRLNPKRHEFVVGDCFDTMAGFAKAKRKFDIILMDPPSFSSTAKSRFTTRGGTSDLVAQALPLLDEGGILVCSSNHQKVDIADYLKEIRRGALQAGCQLKVVTVAGQPEDYPYTVTLPEGRYLKFVVCVKAE